MTLTLSKSMAIGLALAIGSMAAHATLDCPDNSTVRTFHLSADPVVADLVAIPDLAVGGEGQLSMFNVQQATAEGYRDIAIDERGLVANGLEAELLDADFARGMASFNACTDEGFLVLAIYRNETGDIAGAPADVLGITHEVNYANVTEQSNVRIGLEFNRGGAGRALSIIEAGLPDLPDVAGPPIEREVAERVLTENVANVFDFSESQAPVFGFDRAECVVRDHVVLHAQDSECIGQLNPAVTAVAAISATGQLETVSSGNQFTSRPNRLYQATIVQSNTTRTVTFASRFEDQAPATLSNDPDAPTPLNFELGENVVSGEVDTPRNTRDLFTFTVPDGAELTGVFLQQWSAGEDIGFVHIDLESSTVIPSQDTINDFLGGAHISTDLFSTTDNLLEALTEAPQGGTGFEAPLAAGDYTFNIQQTGEVGSRYRLMFLIEEEEEEEEQEPAPATTFSVSNSGASAYIIDGQSNPDLTLVRGETYVFDLNVAGHPFWIKTNPTTGTGNAFDQGVSGNGQSSGQLTFTVPETAPDTLFYICQFHGGMQGQLNIVDP